MIKRGKLVIGIFLYLLVIIFVNALNYDVYYNSSEDLSNSGTTEFSKVNLGINSSGLWLILFSAEVNQSKSSEKAFVYFKNSSSYINRFVFQPDDTTTSRTIRVVSSFYVVNISSSENFSISFNSSSNSYPAGMRRARISAVRLDVLNSNYFYNQTFAEHTLSSNGWEKSLVLNFSLNSSGNYLVMASGEVTTGYQNPIEARVLINSTDSNFFPAFGNNVFYSERVRYDASNYNYAPLIIAGVVNLSSSAYNVSLDVKTGGTPSNFKIRNRRIVLIKLDNVYDYSYNQSLEHNTTISLDYVVRTNLKFSSRSTKYIVLGGMFGKPYKGSNNAEFAWDINKTGNYETEQENYFQSIVDDNDYVGLYSFKGYNFNGQNISLITKYRTDSAKKQAMIKNSLLLVLAYPIYDVIPPNVSIISPVKNFNYTNKSILVNISVQDENLDSVWWFNGTQNISYDINNPIYYNFPEGNNSITAYANDSFGNINHTSVGFYVDSLGPNIVVYSPESKTYSINNISLNFSVSDVSGLSYCWYNINNGVNKTINCYQNTSFNLSDGSYVLYFYSNDTLGNVKNVSRAFSISTSLAVNLLKPLSGAWSKNKNIQFNYSVNTQMQIKNCSLWGNFNGSWGRNQTNSSFINASGGANSFYLNLSDGNYVWNVECYAGSYREFAFENYTLNIDSVNPVLYVNHPLNNSVYEQNLSVLLNFSVSDSNLDSCWYNIDGTNNFFNCNNGINNVIFGYKNGSYNISVYANDSANNVVSFFVYNVTIKYDSVKPNLTLNEPSGIKNTKTSIPINFVVSDNADSANEMNCSYNVTYASTGGIVSGLENVFIQDCGNSYFSVPVDSDYVFYLTVKDRTGNIAVSNSNFSVSTQTPGSGGGGLGGESSGGGGRINFSTKGSLEISKVGEVVVRGGDKKTLFLNVKNIGKLFLNNCKVLGKGEISSWIYSTKVRGISPGEKVDFVFDINVPEEIEQKDYKGELEVKCDEVSYAVDIKVLVLKNNWRIKIKEIKYEKRNLNMNYFFYSEDIGKKASLDIWISDSDNQEVKRIKDSFDIKSKETERNLNIELPDKLVGIYYLYIAPSSEPDNYVKQSIILGKSITGMSIAELGKSGLIFYVVVFVIIFLVVLVIYFGLEKKFIKHKLKIKYPYKATKSFY